MPRARKRAGVASFVLCLFAAGCSPPNDAATPYDSPNVAPPSLPEALARGSANYQRVQNTVSALFVQVAQLRQLAPQAPIDARVIDRETMLRQVRDNLHEQVPPEAIEGESAFLKAFGFLPPDFDYEEGVLRLIEKQLAGYYDPDRKSLFLMDDLAATEVDATLAHELVHALQDQHYDLGPRLKYRPNASDAQGALHALAEGDATSLMLDYLFAPYGRDALSVSDAELRLEIAGGLALSADMAEFPSILRNSLIAPYLDGIVMVHALRRRGGWKAVDEAWAQPPETTEQVLHVDKFLSREPSEHVATPRAEGLGADWKVLHTEQYGEQGLRIALEEWMPRRAAMRAAQGWAGDNAVVLARPRQPHAAAAWRIRFDSTPGAPNREVDEAYRLIAQSFGRPSTTASCCATLGSERVISVTRRDRDLVLAAAPAALSADTCSQLQQWAQKILQGAS